MFSASIRCILKPSQPDHFRQEAATAQAKCRGTAAPAATIAQPEAPLREPEPRFVPPRPRRQEPVDQRQHATQGYLAAHSVEKSFGPRKVVQGRQPVCATG